MPPISLEQKAFLRGRGGEGRCIRMKQVRFDKLAFLQQNGAFWGK